MVCRTASVGIRPAGGLESSEALRRRVPADMGFGHPLLRSGCVSWRFGVHCVGSRKSGLEEWMVAHGCAVRRRMSLWYPVRRVLPDTLLQENLVDGPSQPRQPGCSGGGAHTYGMVQKMVAPGLR